MKIVFVGDANVGKTALFHKFLTNETLADTQATIGVEYQRIKITLPEAKQEVPLVLWDTAGQEKFRSVTTHHYRGTNGALLVYDITVPDSLRNLQKWIVEVEEYAVENVIIAIVANKCDKADSYSASALREEGRSFARDRGCLFFETSAIWDNQSVKSEDRAAASSGKVQLQAGITKLVEAMSEEILRKQGYVMDRQILSLSEDVSCNKELMQSCVC